MVNNPLGINPEPMKTVPGCVWCRLRACADDCPGKYGETFVTVTRETKKTFVRSVHTEECVSPSYMLGVKAATNINLLRAWVKTDIAFTFHTCMPNARLSSLRGTG